MKYHVSLGGREVEVEIEDGAEGRRARVVWKEGQSVVSLREPEGLEAVAEHGARRARVTPLPGGTAQGIIRFLAANRLVEARVESERDRLRSRARPAGTPGGPVTLRSTLPGIIRRILLRPGDPVADGTSVLTLEAMKMENEVRAEGKGRVRAVFVTEGQVVNAGDALAEIEDPGREK